MRLCSLLAAEPTTTKKPTSTPKPAQTTTANATTTNATTTAATAHTAAVTPAAKCSTTEYAVCKSRSGCVLPYTWITDKTGCEGAHRALFNNRTQNASKTEESDAPYGCYARFKAGGFDQLYYNNHEDGLKRPVNHAWQPRSPAQIAIKMCFAPRTWRCWRCWVQNTSQIQDLLYITRLKARTCYI